MNYEDLYQTLTPQEKNVKDHLAALTRIRKTISRETESGDLKNAAKDLDTMEELVSSLSADIAALKASIAGFDAAAYFEKGDFAAQMLTACEEQGVDVKGDFPVYEMFPYRVKLDAENQDIWLDRKKLACMRPKALVENVKKGQQRLKNAGFNEETFLSELAGAYDLAIMKEGKKPGYDIYLSTLYKYLAPMGRFRRDYTNQAYAFDLARLYAANLQETKNGRRFQFGPSRFSKKATRILDQNGQEQYLSTICFYAKEEKE